MAKSQKKLNVPNRTAIDATVKDEDNAEIQQQADTNHVSENVSSSKAKEQNLILLKGRGKKNIDNTISSPGKYVSRYHYATKNIDQYIEFCPHCKKPTMSAFRGAVIDSALDYLEGKRVLIDHKNDPINILKYITYLLAIVTITYFILVPIISII